MNKTCLHNSTQIARLQTQRPCKVLCSNPWNNRCIVLKKVVEVKYSYWSVLVLNICLTLYWNILYTYNETRIYSNIQYIVKQTATSGYWSKVEFGFQEILNGYFEGIKYAFIQDVMRATIIGNLIQDFNNIRFIISNFNQTTAITAIEQLNMVIICLFNWICQLYTLWCRTAIMSTFTIENKCTICL